MKRWVFRRPAPFVGPPRKPITTWLPGPVAAVVGGGGRGGPQGPGRTVARPRLPRWSDVITWLPEPRQVLAFVLPVQTGSYRITGNPIELVVRRDVTHVEALTDLQVWQAGQNELTHREEVELLAALRRMGYEIIE